MELFGLFAEAEERLLAALGTPGARDGEHVVGREGARVGVARRLGKRAVAALVAAEIRERDEHLTRVGHHAAFVSIAHKTGRQEQRDQLVAELLVGEPVALGEVFAGPAKLPLHKEISLLSPVVATVQHGGRLELLGGPRLAHHHGPARPLQRLPSPARRPECLLAGAPGLPGGRRPRAGRSGYQHR